MTLLERDASMESTIVDDEIQLDSGITRVLDDNNNTGAPVSRRFSSGPRRPRSRNVSYLRVRNKGSPVRDGKRWRGGWKKEDNEEERERYIADVTEFLSTSIEHRAQRVGHYCRGTS